MTSTSPKIRVSSLELDWADLSEVKKVFSFMAGQVGSMSYRDVAFAAYGLNACLDARDIAKDLYKNVAVKYREGMIEWFSEAIIARSNLINMKGLGKELSKFVQSIPVAVVNSGEPYIPTMQPGWAFLDVERFTLAGKKVMRVVKEESKKEGFWQGTEVRDPDWTLRYDKEEGRYVLPFNNTTYRFREDLRAMGFASDTINRQWFITKLTDRIKQEFSMEEGASSTGAPSEEEFNQWYLKKWLPANVQRYSALFNDFIQDAGSKMVFTFTADGKGNVSMVTKRGIGKLSDAIEELRLRYLGRQGRETWLQVMDALISLMATSDDPDAIMMVIDHMNMLEHSNGAFIEKFPKSVYSWYVKFLNAKYHTPTVSVLAKNISDSDLRELLVFLSMDVHPEDMNPPDYSVMEKKKDENAVDWLSKGYPYAPGKRPPQKDDPEVQRRLDELRSRGSSVRMTAARELARVARIICKE